NLSSVDRSRVGSEWYEGYQEIRYAHPVISRIDIPDFSSDEERNAIFGSAYFHRAYRYFKLTHQFGDVPYLDWEIETPIYDFYSYDRWSILERMRKDLEFAYEWVPEVVD